jgi:hypothetical protein
VDRRSVGDPLGSTGWVGVADRLGAADWAGAADSFGAAERLGAMGRLDAMGWAGGAGRAGGSVIVGPDGAVSSCDPRRRWSGGAVSWAMSPKAWARSEAAAGGLRVDATYDRPPAGSAPNRTSPDVPSQPRPAAPHRTAPHSEQTRMPSRRFTAMTGTNRATG